MTGILWTIQGLLALLFLFAGVMKLVTPAEALEAQSGMSGLLLQFIGLCEALGALGLVLPGLFRTRQELTSLAASGLAIIMAGATVTSVPTAGVMAAIPLVIGLLSAFVAWNRAASFPTAARFA